MNIQALNDAVAQNPFDWPLFAILADAHEELGQTNVARLYRNIFTKEGRGLSSQTFARWLGYACIKVVRTKSTYLGPTPVKPSVYGRYFQNKSFTPGWPREHVMLTPARGRWFLWKAEYNGRRSIQEQTFDTTGCQVFDDKLEAIKHEMAAVQAWHRNRGHDWEVRLLTNHTGRNVRFALFAGEATIADYGFDG